MSLFRSFRAVLLISLFLCSMASTAVAQSVAELESAVKNCQDSWRSMGNRYQQECGKIDEVVAREMRNRVQRGEMPPDLKRKEAECLGLYNECSALDRRRKAAHDACVAAGGKAEDCDIAPAVFQLVNAAYGCWTRSYSPCRDAFNETFNEWRASIRAEKEASCQRLAGQWRSIVEACQKLEKDLNTARNSQPQTQPQTTATSCVFIDGPRPEGDRVTFAATLDQYTQANLLNVAYSGRYSWLLDGAPIGETNSAVTIQSPSAGTHEISVTYWIDRLTGSERVLCNARKSFSVGPTATPPTRTTTGRMVKIGYLNYQKLPGFTVTVNGTTKSCSEGCSFDVPAGPCSISVQAPGCKTESFQRTCDKDETVMTTLGKAP